MKKRKLALKNVCVVTSIVGWFLIIILLKTIYITKITPPLPPETNCEYSLGRSPIRRVFDPAHYTVLRMQNDAYHAVRYTKLYSDHYSTPPTIIEPRSRGFITSPRSCCV